MKKIGITGSVASGKTTASKILAKKKRGPLFSADKVVKELYKERKFKNLLSKKFNIKNKLKLKQILKKKILSSQKNLKKLEQLIHPLVRKKMFKFIKKNEYKKFIFLEIPLLVESKLMKNFDIIIFIKAKKSLRLNRFIKKGGNKKLFDLLNKKQLSDAKKAKFCDYIVVNENNLNILQKKLLDIVKIYE